MFQDYTLFPNLTVRGNVAYALGKESDPWIEELLHLAGLDALQDRLPAEGMHIGDVVSISAKAFNPLIFQ